ncbi:MAG: acyltransferase domain-containing protein [Candidatus Sumerlaeota bacterium]|nr:acyltransferase domain-containing protein [Candidatus Sumerlaeota bacterium]
MELRKILNDFDASEAYALFEPRWQESVDTYAELPILSDNDLLREACAFCGLDQVTTDHALEFSRAIARTPGLALLFWHCHRLVYVAHEYPQRHFTRWPLFSRLGKDAGAFYLLLALSIVPSIRLLHQARGIPESVSRASLFDVALNVRRFSRVRPGLTGILPRGLHWFRRHAGGGLLRIDRLEYIITPFQGTVTVLRHRRSGATLALSQAGIAYQADGLRPVVPLPGGAVPAGGFVSQYAETEEHISGNPVLPVGVVLRDPLALVKSAWEKRLSPGAPVLEMHIPEGGGMGLDVCFNSMRQAIDFFRRYFPDQPFTSIAMQSWILSPDWERIYRPDANFVQLQREVYLYPLPNDGKVLYFIFDRDDVDLKTALRDTSLRRAILDHLGRGGILRNGGMVFLVDDIERFGTQQYRNGSLFLGLKAQDRAALAEYDIAIWREK